MEAIDGLKDGGDFLAYTSTQSSQKVTPPARTSTEAQIYQAVNVLDAKEGSLALASYYWFENEGEESGWITGVHNFLKDLFFGD